ncbi:MAG: hypothetical protein QOJ65_1189, partial [Fimbriimonadaceae bacterium]|nr:hypothetical protein [Fimbriimonadaceae bacterium]
MRVVRTGKLLRGLIVATAASLVAAGIAQPYLSQPVLVLDFPARVGTIDGDHPRYLSMTLLNPWFRKVDVESVNCGCSSTDAGGKVTIPPFARKTIK